MKKIILITGLIFSFYASRSQDNYSLASPDGSIQILLDIGTELSYSVEMDDKHIISNSPLSLKLEGYNTAWNVKEVKSRHNSSIVEPQIWQKSESIKNEYNELEIAFKNNLSLQWRAYNDGIAWRWKIRHKGEYKILDEQVAVNFTRKADSWFPEESGFYSHNERHYKQYKTAELDTSKLASLPALFGVGDIRLLLTESDLFDYPGMWITGTSNSKGIQATFPKYPKLVEQTSDRDEKIITREDFLAIRKDSGTLPWRIICLERNDIDLIGNQLVYLLARPAKGNYDWVKPGKVAWDWWNNWSVYGVDFEAGINTATYKYYIDFAANNNLAYIILDEGWSPTEEITKVIDALDMPEVLSYAESKGVGVILWVSWLGLRDQLIPALDLYKSWGVKGIKVDFMQRDDQLMVQFYEKVSKEAAKRKLLVDFHGAYKPTGWIRTYPNVLTSEGVLGNELNKFLKFVTPDHTTTIPFIRMVAGPMDFTPGGMLNAQDEYWRAVSTEPMTMGTRCQQLAMYVVYESPLQMLCDSPTKYYDEPECMGFLKSVPVEWKKTIPLQGKVGDYIAVARQAKNGDWYIGAMTDWDARDLVVDLSFLGPGQFNMRVWKDGLNANKIGKDFSVEEKKVDNKSTINIQMAKGGGWVARITPH